MQFTENPSSNSCLKTYALEFWDDDKRIWEPYNSAVHTFVKSGTFTSAAGTFTIDASYESHKWSAPPQYSIIAKLSVTAPETASANSYVAEEFEIIIQEKCRLVQL